MREIKFRAWHELNKTMVYFNPKTLTDDYIQATFLAKLMNGDFGDVLMQYTGIKDADGVEIYEGDIMKVIDGSINGCLWTRPNLEIKILYGSVNLPLWVRREEWDSTHYIEVIGNIHENPELLELEK
jgi:hypothetical protein